MLHSELRMEFWARYHALFQRSVRAGAYHEVPPAATAQPVAEKWSLIEEIDTHPVEHRDDSLDDIRVDDGPGLRLDLGEGGVGSHARHVTERERHHAPSLAPGLARHPRRQHTGAADQA